MNNGNNTDLDAVLSQWATALAAELELDGLLVDVDTVLAIAGAAAHAIVRPAAPLTTYLVGYAAGAAAASGADSEVAFAKAAKAAIALASLRAEATGS